MAFESHSDDFQKQGACERTQSTAYNYVCVKGKRIHTNCLSVANADAHGHADARGHADAHPNADAESKVM